MPIYNGRGDVFMTVSQTNGIFLKNFSAEETVDMMTNGGFDAIDFDFSLEEYHGEHTDGIKWKERFLYLKDYAHSKGIYFNQAHAPFPSGTNVSLYCPFYAKCIIFGCKKHCGTPQAPSYI